MGWGCDLSWDCFWAVLWALEVGLSVYVVVNFEERRRAGYVHLAFALAMFAMYVATAAMVGRVRERVKWRATNSQQDVECGGKPCTTAPVVVKV